jgi:hypothetical protein
MKEETVVSVIRNTAKNMHELLMQLADHIERLENENIELRVENESHRNRNQTV